MKEVIHLEDIVPNLKNTYIKLEPSFLKKLLKDASKSEKPHRNKKFIEKIDCKINKKAKFATIITGWMQGSSMPIPKLKKIVQLSKYTWRRIEGNILHLNAGGKSGKVYLNFPIKVDQELGSIVGHILGDGSIDKGLHAVFFSNSNVVLLKEFRVCMKNVFGIEPRIWVQEKKKFEDKTKWLKRIYNINDAPKGNGIGLFYPKICSDVLYAMFGKFAEGWNKRITKDIMNANLNFKKGLVRGFFDDDGSITVSSYTVNFAQDDKELLEDVKLLIGEFNIKTNKVRFAIRRGKRRHEFGITGFREYHMFYYKIGCSSPHKKEKFELLINKVGNSKFFRNKYKEYRESICFEKRQL
tara:strand:- start:1669 stop:2730 length:1062 start_codon:yes stop_codon:yes gene_type:complete